MRWTLVTWLRSCLPTFLTVKLPSLPFHALFRNEWLSPDHAEGGSLSYTSWRRRDLHILFWIHLEGKLSLLSHLFIYSNIYFKQYGRMGIYFIFQVIIQHYVDYFAQIIPALAIGSTFRLAPPFRWHAFIYLFLEHFLDFWCCKMLYIILYFPVPG